MNRRSYLRTVLQSGGDYNGVGIISMEEQEILLTEAAQDLAEADEVTKDTARLEDVADALEDLAENAETIEEATATDLVMVETASRMAVAGSDVDSEEITPALESYLGKRISMEGPRELARQIWDAIKAAVKKIYEKIESFFYKILGTIPRLRRAVEDTRKRLKKMEGQGVKETKTMLGSEANSLIIYGQKLKSGSQIVDGLKTLESQAKFFMVTRAKDVGAMGDAIEDGINEFNVDNGENSLKNIFNKVSAARTAAAPGGMKDVKGDSRFADKEYEVASALPGNVSLFWRNGRNAGAVTDSDGNYTLGDAERQRRRGWSMQATSSKTKDPLTELEIGTLNSGDIDSILELILQIADHVEHYNRSSDWKKVKETRGKIEKAADKASKSMEKDDDTTTNDLSFYRSAIKYSSFYAQYSTRPMASLTAHGLKVCRAALVACNKSISNYG